MQENLRLTASGGGDVGARGSVASSENIKVRRRVFCHKRCIFVLLFAQGTDFPLYRQVLDAVFGLPFEVKRNQRRQLSPYR